MHQMQPVNRIAGYFKAMAEIKTKTDVGNGNLAEKQEQTPLQRNLRTHMDRMKMSAETLKAKIIEHGEEIRIETVERWLNGETDRPTKSTRKILAKIFGYHNPDSIFHEDHIAARQDPTHPATRPNVSAAGGFATLLKSFDAAIDTSPEDTLAAADELLHSDLAPYVAIAIHWLKAKQA